MSSFYYVHSGEGGLSRDTNTHIDYTLNLLQGASGQADNNTDFNANIISYFFLRMEV